MTRKSQLEKRATLQHHLELMERGMTHQDFTREGQSIDVTDSEKERVRSRIAEIDDWLAHNPS